MAEASTIICGISSESGRSILYQSAIHWAKEGCKVLYITKIKFDHIPLTAHGPQIPPTEVLNKIRIVYLENMDEFLKFVFDVVTFRDTVPRVILVENLDLLVSEPASRSGDHVLGRASAVLNHVASHCAAQCGLPVHLLVTTAKATPPVIHAMFRYVWTFSSEDNALTRQLPVDLPNILLKMSFRSDGAYVLSEVSRLLSKR